ncbi:hypothetical protein BLNAU_2266 [Blattamonas nauphoetae]|uniref:Uncharacterized protein n=1 Tax=Blattamonas nauphoetae TaxID=2049346 RepID=A0ABQ9YGE8_9EUKA|nr:hypothetical protein BLNAU_2266 [Blattamonas nauphoetae]
MATLEAVRVVVDPTQSRLTVSSGTRQDRDNSLVYHIISPLVSAMWLPQRLSRLCSFVTPAPRTVFDSLLILQDHLVDQLQTNIPFLSRALKLYSDENTEGDAFTADSVVSTLLALLPPAAQRVLRQLLPDLPQSTEQASVVGDTSVDIQRFMLERLPDVVLTVYSLFSFLNHPTDPNHVSHRISTYIRNLFPSLSTIPILFRTCLDCIDHFVATLADNQSILTNGAQVLFEMVRSILDVFQTMMNAHELLTFLYILSTVCVSILLKRPLNFEHILKSMQNAPLDSILFLSSVFHSPIHQRLGKKDYLWQNDNILTRQTMESERLLPNPHPLEMWLFGYAKKITRLLEKSNICIVSDPDMQLDQMYSGISSFIDSQTVRLKVTQTKGEFISQLKDIIKKAISSPLTTVVLFNVTDLLQLTQQYGLASIYLSTTSSDETHSTNESSSTPTIGNVQHEKEYGHEFDYMNNIDGQRMSLLLSQEATNDPNEILSAQFASQLLRALTQARYGILYLFSESELESLADEAVLQGKIQARSVNWFVGEVRRKIKYIFEVTVCDANQHPTSYLYLEDRFRLRKVYVNDEDFGQEIQDSLNRRVKIKRRPIVLLGLDYMDWVINAFHMFRLQNYPLYQLEEPIRTVIPSGSCKQMIIKEQKAREDTPNFINFDESVKKGTNDGLLHILEKRRQDRMNKDKTMSRISRVFILDERVFTADQEPAIPVLLIPGISNFDTTTIPPLPLTSKGAFIHFLLSVSRTVRQPTRPRQIPVPPLLVSKRLSPIVTFPKPEGSVKMGPPRSLTRIGTAVVGGRRRPGNARNQKASVISGIPSRATLSHDKGSLSSIHHDRSTFTHITNKGMSSYELTRSKTSLSHDQSLSSVPRDRSPPPDLIGASSLELTIFSALIKQINQQNNPELTIDTADLTTFTLHIWKQLFHSSTIANKETTIFYAVMVSMHASVKQDYGLLTYANATSEWFTHRVVRFTSLQILKFAHMFARTYSRRITFLEQLKESQENLIKLFTAREQGRVISQPITSEMQGWNVRNFGKLFETVRKVRADMNELSLKKEDLKQRTKNLETTKRELHKDRMSITRKLNVQDTTLSEIKHKFSPSRMSNFLTGKKNNLGNNLIHEVLCLLTNQPLPRMSLLEITLTHINNGVGISGLIRQSSTLTRKLPPPIRNNGMTSLFQTISNFTAVTVTAEQIEFLEPYHELIRSDWADNALLGQNSLFEQFYHGSIADYHVRHHVAPHFKKLITLQSQFEKEMKSLHRAIVEADDLRAMILANLHDLNNTLDYVTHINHPNPQKCITPEPLEAKPENLPSREPQKSGLTQETLYNALHRIRQNIVHCRGDCMLTAAFIIFNGSIPVSDWDCQMTKWMRLLDIAGIPYTPVPHVSLPVDESGPNYATEPYEVHIHPEERVLNTNKDLLALDSTLSLSQFDLLHSLSYSNIRPTLRTVFAVLNGPSTALLGQANGLPPNELSLMGASIIRYVSDVPIMLLDWSGIMLQWLVSFYRQFGNVILTSVLSVTFFDDVIESLVRGYPLFVEYEDIHPSVDQVRCENIQNCIEVLLDCALSGHLNGVDICGRRILPQTRLRFFLCVKSATALMPPTFITNRPIEHEFVVVNCNPLCSSSLFTNWFKYGLLGPMLLPEQILVRKAAWGRIYHSYQTIASEFAQFHSNIDLGKSGIVALHAHFRSIKGLADNLHQLIQREVDVIENNDRILSHLDMFCIYIHKVHQISQSTVAVPLVHFVSYCTPKFISSRPLVESGIPSSSIFSVMVFECVRRAMMLKLYDRSLQQTKDVITQLLDGEVPEDILLPNDSGTTINYIHFNTDEIIEILNDLRDKEYPLAHINFILVTACGFLLKRILSGLKETVYTSSRKSFTRFQGKSIQIGVGLNTIGLIEPYLVPTLESRTPSTGIVEAYRHEIDLSFTEKDRYIATHFPLNTLCLDSPVTRRYIHTEDHLRLVDFCQELLSPRFLFTQPKTLAPRHLPGRLQTARARHSSTTSFFAMFDQRVSQSAATLEPIHEIPQDGLSGTEVEMLLLDEIMAIWDIPHTSLLDSFRENPIDWNDWILSDQPEQTPFPFSEEYDPYPLMWYAIITHLVPHRAAAAFYEFTRRIVVFTVEDVHIVEEDIAVAIDTSCQSIASFLHTNTHLFDIDPYIGRLENAIIHQATYSLQRKTLDVPRLFIVSMPVGEMHRHVNLSSILSEDRPIPLQMLYGRTPLTEMTFEELGKLSTVKVKMELLFGVKNIIKKSSASVDINQIERRGLCCQRPLPAFVATTGNQWMEYSVIPDFLSAIHDSTYFHLFVSIPPNLFFKTDLLASKQFTATIIKGMKDGQTTSPRSLTDYPKSRTSPWTDFIYTQHVHCDPTFIHAIPQVAEQDTGDVTAPQVIYQLTDKKHIYPRLYESCSRLLVLDKENIFRPGIHLSYVAGIVAHHIEHQTTFKALLASALARIPYDYETNVDISFWGQLLFAVVFFYTWMKWRSVTLNYSSFILTKFRKPGIYAQPFFLSILRVTRSIFQSTSSLSSCLHQLRNSIHWLLLDLKVPSDDLEVGTELLFRLLVPQLSVIPFDFVSVLDGYYDCSMSFSLPVVLSGTTFNRKHAVKYVTATFPDLSPQQVSITSSIDRMRTMSMTLIEMQTIQRSVFRLTALARTPQEQALISPSDQKNNIFMENMIDLLQFLNAEKGTTTPKFIPPVALHCPTPIFFSKLVKETHSLTAALMTLHFSICSCLDTVCLRSPLDFLTSQFRTELFSPKNSFASNRFDALFADSVPIPVYVTFNQSDVIQWFKMKHSLLTQLLSMDDPPPSVMPLSLLLNPSAFLSGFIIEGEQWLSNFSQPLGRAFFRDSHRECNENFVDHDKPTRLPDPRTSPGHLEDQDDSDTILIDIEPRLSCLHMSLVSQDPITLTRRCFVTKEHGLVCLYVTGIMLNGCAWDFELSEFVDIPMNNALGPTQTQTPLVRFSFGVETKDELILPDRYDTRSIYSLNGLAGQYHPPVSPVPLFRFDDSQSQIRLQRDSSALFMVRSVASMYEAELSRESSEKSQNRITMTPGRPNHPSLRSSYRKLFQRRNMSPRYLWPSSQPSTPLSPQKASQPTLHRLQIALPDSWPSTGSAEYNHGAGRHTLNRDRSGGNMASSVDVSVYSSAAKQKVAFRASLQHSDFEGWARKGCYLFLHFNPEYLVSHRHVFGLLSLE